MNLMSIIYTGNPIYQELRKDLPEKYKIDGYTYSDEGLGLVIVETPESILLSRRISTLANLVTRHIQGQIVSIQSMEY